MSQEPKVTRFGADPTVDQELATKIYVDSTAGGATVTQQRDELAGDVTTTSTTYVATPLTITLGASGEFLAIVTGTFSSTAGNAISGTIFHQNGVKVENGTGMQTVVSGRREAMSTNMVQGTADGTALLLLFATHTATLTYHGAVSSGIDLFGAMIIQTIS